MNITTLYQKPAPGGEQQMLAVAGSAVALDSTKFLTGATVAWQVQGAAVRCTFDGSTPSTSNGFLLEAGASGVWSAGAAQAARFIQESSAATICAQPFTN